MPPKKRFKFEIRVDRPKRVLSRILKATETTTIEELAAILHCRPSRISGAIRIRCIPMSWIVELHATRGISPLWVISGGDDNDIYCEEIYLDAESLYTAF